jgi:hypothetical protein
MCWNAADLRALAGLAESGAIRPAIDRTYPLAGGGEAIRARTPPEGRRRHLSHLTIRKRRRHGRQNPEAATVS